MTKKKTSESRDVANKKTSAFRDMAKEKASERRDMTQVEASEPREQYFDPYADWPRSKDDVLLPPDVLNEQPTISWELLDAPEGYYDDLIPNLNPKFWNLKSSDLKSPKEDVKIDKIKVALSSHVQDGHSIIPKSSREHIVVAPIVGSPPAHGDSESLCISTKGIYEWVQSDSLILDRDGPKASPPGDSKQAVQKPTRAVEKTKGAAQRHKEAVQKHK